MSKATKPITLPRSRKKRKRRAVLATPQQRNAVKLIEEAILGNTTESLYDLLQRAGYSAESARQQSNVMAGIRQHLDPFVAKLVVERDRAIDAMKVKIDFASYSDVALAAHRLTHDIRLLSGQSTSNIDLVDKERRDELDRLFA